MEDSISTKRLAATRRANLRFVRVRSVPRRIAPLRFVLLRSDSTILASLRFALHMVAR